MLDERFLTVEDLCRYLKIGRNKAYSLCKSPTFPTFRIDKKIFVDKEKLEIWIKNQQEITN